MPLASANRVALGIIAESIFGTTPGSGTAKNLRYTGESFAFDLSKESSKEIRSDRQNPAPVTVDAAVSGGFNFEMQYREYDALLEGALFNPFTVYGTDGVGSSFTATFTTTTITASVAPVGANAFTTLQRGQFFRMTTGGVNNGKLFRVDPSTDPTATVITLDSNLPAVAGAAIANCVVQASRLTNGVVQKFFSIEKQFLDVSQYFLYKGLCVSKLNWKFAAGALSDGSFEFMGKDGVRAGATGLPSALAASQPFKIQNGVRNISQLWENGAPLTTTYIKSLDLTVDNNLRSQTALANLGPVGIGVGDCKVMGSATIFFSSGDQYDRFIGDTETPMVFGTQDGLGNGYIVSLPKVTFTTAKVLAGSKNTDVMVELGFEAAQDDANATVGLRKTIFIDRVGVVAV